MLTQEAHVKLGGGENFHETSSSNDLSRGVEDYAQQE